MKKQLVVLSVAVVLALSGCGADSKEGGTAQGDHSSMNHSAMNHSGSGEIPQGLDAASNPKFPVGSQVILKNDHMPGMNGATATVVGAYDTIAYSVSYIPTDGGEPVNDHKWVIHEELKDAGDAAYEPGAEVVLEAEHMKGMKGAKAVIDTAENMTVYVVDYVPIDGGEAVKNHKWMTEDELSAE